MLVQSTKSLIRTGFAIQSRGRPLSGTSTPALAEARSRSRFPDLDQLTVQIIYFLARQSLSQSRSAHNRTEISSGRSRRSDLAPRGVQSKLLQQRAVSDTMSRARIQEGVASFGAEREFQAARQLDIVPARARERHLAVIGRLFAAASSPADLTAQPLRHSIRHWRP